MREQTVLEKFPEPPGDPLEALKQLLWHHRDTPDERMVVEATSSIYAPGVQTGLTMGDLRALRGAILVHTADRLAREHGVTNRASGKLRAWAEED